LLGGAAGFAGFYATFYAAFSLATVLGIAAGPVVLCIAAVAGLAGTFAGKFSVDKLLVQERIDKYKASFKQAVKKQFHEMKISSAFTETVRRQVYASFQGLKAKIENETEIILLDTQKTLDNLNELKTERKTMSENEKEKLQTIAEYTGSLLAETYNLHKILTDNMGE
ncbi:MAG: dynamin, partial [Oscillospiraceae bacterium]|nr:dynamin [Oscillospiraceae bacterium]